MHFTYNLVDLGWVQCFKKQVFKLSIEVMQVWPRNKWRKCCSLKLNSNLDRKTSIEIQCWNSTQTVSVENYEIKFSRSDYTHIPMYLCRVSFLTTLDIYKDYFKSHHKVMQSNNTCILWPEAEITLVYYYFSRSHCVFTPRVLWPRSFLIFIVDELKNFVANIFFKLVY